MPDIVILKSAADICAYIGENPKDIAKLVRDENLPAWKRNGTGTWRALPQDLSAWAQAQRDKYLNACQ